LSVLDKTDKSALNERSLRGGSSVLANLASYFRSNIRQSPDMIMAGMRVFFRNGSPGAETETRMRTNLIAACILVNLILGLGSAALGQC